MYKNQKIVKQRKVLHIHVKNSKKLYQTLFLINNIDIIILWEVLFINNDEKEYIVEKIQKYSDFKEINEMTLKNSKKHLILSSCLVGSIALAIVLSLLLRGEANITPETLGTSSSYTLYLGYNIAKIAGLKKQRKIIERTIFDYEQLYQRGKKGK